MFKQRKWLQWNDKYSNESMMKNVWANCICQSVLFKSVKRINKGAVVCVYRVSDIGDRSRPLSSSPITNLFCMRMNVVFLLLTNTN